MKKVLISLVLAVVLMLAVAAPAMAAAVETSKTATVTVNEYINATLTDNGTSGINFGSLDSGTSNNPADGQPATGAVTMTIGAETNVAVKTGVKGVDFSDGASHTIAIGQASWNTTNTPGTATAMTTSYAQVGSDSTPGVQQIQQIYHWLSIPNGQYPAAYTSTFTYKANKTL